MVEEEYKPYSEEEETEVKKKHKGGRILIFEPTDLRELLASPMAMTSFKYLVVMIYVSNFDVGASTLDSNVEDSPHVVADHSKIHSLFGHIQE